MQEQLKQVCSQSNAGMETIAGYISNSSMVGPVDRPRLLRSELHEVMPEHVWQLCHLARADLYVDPSAARTVRSVERRGGGGSETG